MTAAEGKKRKVLIVFRMAYLPFGLGNSVI